MKERIKKAVSELGYENQQLFTMAELEKIARMAKAQIVDVMYYLRYERKTK